MIDLAYIYMLKYGWKGKSLMVLTLIKGGVNLMGKCKMTAEEKLIKVSFGNCYKKALPREDEEMFFVLSAIELAKNFCKFAKRVMSAKDSSLQSENEMKRYDEKIEKFSDCYKNFMEYICEVKNFPKKDRAELYSDWYRMMKTKYDENKKEWYRRIKEETYYILLI